MDKKISKFKPPETKTSSTSTMTISLSSKSTNTSCFADTSSTKIVPLQTNPDSSPSESFCQATTSSVAASNPSYASSPNLSSMIAHMIPLRTLPSPTISIENSSSSDCTPSTSTLGPSEADKKEWMREIMEMIDNSRIMK